MRKLFWITVPWAIGIGLATGLFFLAVRDWRYATLTTWLLGMGLLFGVWFPLVLVPYLRGRR